MLSLQAILFFDTLNTKQFINLLRMRKKVYIINGPNLNLLGKRENDIYGNLSFEEYFEEMKRTFPQTDLFYFQSNVEGELVSKIQEVSSECDGIILNAAAYTHTSVAIADAISAIETPVVEVHISNVTSREEFRHTSLITPVCRGLILGFGLNSYSLALASLL